MNVLHTLLLSGLRVFGKPHGRIISVAGDVFEVIANEFNQPHYYRPEESFAAFEATVYRIEKDYTWNVLESWAHDMVGKRYHFTQEEIVALFELYKQRFPFEKTMVCFLQEQNRMAIATIRRNRKRGTTGIFQEYIHHRFCPTNGMSAGCLLILP